MRLSSQQREALSAMPFEIAFWGGRPFAGWPGKFTTRTIDSLVRLGLAQSKKAARFDVRYEITAEGRKWLAEAGY